VAILSAFSLQLTNRQNKLRLFFSGKSFWLSLMFEGRISDEEKSFVTLTLIGLDRENLLKKAYYICHRDYKLKLTGQFITLTPKEINLFTKLKSIRVKKLHF